MNGVETNQEVYPGMQGRGLSENIIRSLTSNDEYVQQILQQIGDLKETRVTDDNGEFLTNKSGEFITITVLGNEALVNKKGFKNIILRLKAINKDLGLGFRHYNEIEKELRFDVPDFVCSLKENYFNWAVSRGDIRTIISLYDKLLSAMLYKSYKGHSMKSVAGVTKTRETIKSEEGKGGRGLFSKFKGGGE